MRRKGFTLIELLAVIVILAIIALIATPIIIEIEEDATKESEKRSIEMYASAIKNAIVAHQLVGGKGVDVGRYTTDTLPMEVEYEGDIYCESIEIQEEGTLYLADCIVNGNKVEYKYGTSKELVPKSFAEDSWKTIIANVRVGNLSKYKVGDTKEIELKKQIIRISNTSTPDDCNTKGYSQTACGFVIEFVDIITNQPMNNTYTNVGGWPASKMRTYVNNTIYNALPQNLKKYIIDTQVVSSHGSSDSTNFTSTDKLYLLSTKEVLGKEGTSYVIDTAEAETRQLDYYKNKGVTTSNYSGAIKNYNGSASLWWLRSASSNYAHYFYRVSSSGDWNYRSANYTYGVAPAFRIG